MKDQERIRYLAANLPEMQGLKAIPVGLFLSYVFLKEPGIFTVDCFLLPALIALYALFHLYYQKTFGRVEATKDYKRQYYLLSLGVMAVAIIGMAVDVYFPLPISVFGVAFALVMLWTQAWMVQQAGSRNWALFPGGLVCIGLVFCSAFLPLLGNETIRRLGFPTGLNLVVVVVGLLYVLYGVLEHFFLVRSLSPSVAAEPDRSVDGAGRIGTLR